MLCRLRVTIGVTLRHETSVLGVAVSILCWNFRLTHCRFHFIISGFSRESVAQKFASIQSRAMRAVLTSDGSRPVQGHDTVQGHLGCGCRRTLACQLNNPPPRRDRCSWRRRMAMPNPYSPQSTEQGKSALPHMSFFVA